MTIVPWIIAGALFLILLGLIGFIAYKSRKDRQLLETAEYKVKNIIESAKKEAEQIKKAAEIEVREIKQQIRDKIEKELEGKRRHLEELEKKLDKKEDILEQRSNYLDKKDLELQQKERELKQLQEGLIKDREELQKLISKEMETLEQISGYSREEAKRELMRLLEEDAKKDIVKKLRKMEEEAEFTAKNKAREIISLAIQKSASDYVSESTVSVVDLPNDEMKGRIIGREGRNIRAIEKATGVDLIIDDTPEAVILSSFDPIRREVARLALEKLIADGRIHPARIEDVVEKVKLELDAEIKKEGENTVFELGIGDIHPKLIKLIGRLKYRTSYGQNILQHSKEVAYIAAFMAHELGANVKVAKRAALLHDIGKAIDKEVEGTHVEIGVDLLRRFGESEEVIHAVEAHHGDVEPKTVEAVIVQSADALSAARPGARREILESYIRRLEKLEEIASSFEGVHKSYAIQAGREIRVIVNSDLVDDDKIYWLSKEIARRIEEELDYPGQIKVTIIRETRAVEYAR
ncbi:ribonucrease Y [Thermotomaculum hydrothermale]|uniref:Ribonuclease Y n=1 Tax=Thermotomaculum hydrothermale TaxID=981385 RepID=A0A7R6PP33_9BACT|nr:ribonuclease Y [Thermotomaculum hydrothermale]BBB31766.1 ribonucrease Y [Thermotomaculum hydrothermale]